MAQTTPREYPVLAEMGIDKPLFIADYYVTSLQQVDSLRIVFERRKDAFFTSSRTYRFPRVAPPGAQTVPVGDAPALVTHPKLRAVQRELDEIVESKSTRRNLAERILHEIELLEEDIAMRAECLRILAGKVPEVD